MIIRAKLIILVAKVKMAQNTKMYNRADRKNLKNLTLNQNPNQKSRMIPTNQEVIFNKKNIK
jgi:hypothetical protein